MNQVINKNVQYLSFKIIDYKQAWDFQEMLLSKIVDIKIGNRNAVLEEYIPTPNFLIFCQHPHVFTLGKSGKESNLLLGQKELERVKANFYKINRGGDITYHGPGQIVGYPVLDLENFFTDIHKYLRLLEEAVILTLKEYEIIGGRIKGLTGVWIDHEKQINPRKICALGVKTSRWVTMHGFAFNINTDLDYFNYIIPCGIPDKAVTSMARELGVAVDITEVEKKLQKNIITLFEMNLKEGNELTDLNFIKNFDYINC
ncbi:lipoyl(octanoyl) transferase LipB [soil metagenome]